jgi:hypothetical protein
MLALLGNRLGPLRLERGRRTPFTGHTKQGLTTHLAGRAEAQEEPRGDRSRRLDRLTAYKLSEPVLN